MTLCILAGCAFFTTGCWNGRLLVCAEQPYWTSLGDDLRVRASLALASLPKGYIPRVLVVGAPAGLSKTVAGGRFGTVVVGPLISLEAFELARAFPRTRFLLVGVSPGAEAPPNAAVLVFTRADAFRAAGYAAGQSVLGEAGGAGAPGARIGVLAAAGTDAAARDRDAFAGGVSDALGGALPVAREIDAPIDRAKAKAAVEQMRKDGVEIVLLRLGAADPWCLEAMKEAGGCAVVSDWASSRAYPAQVFLSVEDDLIGGIARFLDRAARGNRVVDGPVLLVEGEARKVPEDARAKGGAR